MTAFLSLWSTWAFLFRAVPYGDPYLAALILVVLAVATAKALRSAARNFWYV